MKKAIYFIVFLAFAALILQALTPKPPTKEQQEKMITEVFKKTSEEMNKQTPRLIDNETRLERTEAGPGPRFTYFYSFVNYASRDVDPLFIRTKLEPSLWSEVCQNKSMVTAIKNGATYVYAFSGNDRTEIIRFEYKITTKTSLSLFAAQCSVSTTPTVFSAHRP